MLLYAVELTPASAKAMCMMEKILMWYRSEENYDVYTSESCAHASSP